MPKKELTQREIERRAKNITSQLLKAHDAGSSSLVALMEGEVSLDELFERVIRRDVKRRVYEILRLEEETRNGFKPFLG